MLQDLAERAAVAAADDADMFCIPVRQDRHMGQHFVIDEFVSLGGLDDTVQTEHPAEFGRPVKSQRLVAGVAFVKNFLDFQTEPVAFAEAFIEPAPAFVLRHAALAASVAGLPRRTSSKRSRRGAKA